MTSLTYTSIDVTPVKEYFSSNDGEAVEEQTRKNSNFPVRGIFKNPREIIVNIFR